MARSGLGRFGLTDNDISWLCHYGRVPADVDEDNDSLYRSRYRDDQGMTEAERHAAQLTLEALNETASRASLTMATGRMGVLTPHNPVGETVLRHIVRRTRAQRASRDTHAPGTSSASSTTPPAPSPASRRTSVVVEDITMGVHTPGAHRNDGQVRDWRQATDRQRRHDLMAATVHRLRSAPNQRHEHPSLPRVLSALLWEAASQINDPPFTSY